MSRSTYAVPSRKRRKMVLARAKGFYGNASRNIRTAYDAVDKALVHSYTFIYGLWMVAPNCCWCYIYIEFQCDDPAFGMYNRRKEFYSKKSFNS